ncbi:hypothetical protein DEO72_LG1g1503 [Vigna unguiculata]|uniref:Uncharacterized protein n=1 Tax=Vigna unguiculata TaxID=3917 RepID=A0A4D6KMU0_VIGUN|nr:hypothetical protein DEO72_LG1g1503 [Vigna unguiculata]
MRTSLGILACATSSAKGGKFSTFEGYKRSALSSPTPGRPTSTFKVTVPGLQTPSYPSMVWTLVLGASLRCPGLAPTPSLVRGGPITSSGMLGSYNGWRGLSIWTRLEGSFPFLQVSQLLV